jgi:hypothetical protein
MMCILIPTETRAWMGSVESMDEDPFQEPGDILRSDAGIRQSQRTQGCDLDTQEPTKL